MAERIPQYSKHTLPRRGLHLHPAGLNEAASVLLQPAQSWLVHGPSDIGYRVGRVRPVLSRLLMSAASPRLRNEFFREKPACM
jgi:hypothetical protein